jgi:signal peptide peptidase SppA
MSSNARSPGVRVFNAICKRPWAITEEWLQTILTIAARENPSIQAVESQLGKPLANTHAVTTRDSVASIPVNGPIFRYADMFTQVSGATSIDTLATDLRSALDDPAINAIVLDIDSPGGEVNGTGEFADMVYQARGQKPIVAYVSDQGCSAAYWIASAADEVVVAETALVGSIGVVAAVPKAEDTGEIQFVSSQSPNKRVDPSTESGSAQIQAIVDDLAGVFVGGVARNRGVTADEVIEGFGQGGVFVGQRAVDAGLADRVGSYETVMAELAKRQAAQRPFSFAAKTTPKTTPKTTRSIHMSLRDLFKTTAEERGIALTDEEIDAEMSAAATSQVEVLRKELAARDAREAEMNQRLKDQEAAFARAADEKRKAEAMAFAQAQVSAHRITPGAADALASLYERVAMTDASAKPGSLDGPTTQLLASFVESIPAELKTFTEEHTKPGAVGVIFNGSQEPDPKKQEEREKELLAYTPVGQRVLSGKN